MMEHDGSSTVSSVSDNDSDDSISSCSSVEASEELYLSVPTEVSPYRFEPVYSRDEEPGSSSVPMIVSMHRK